MTLPRRYSLLVLGIVLLMVLLDQAVKLHIHYHFYLGEAVDVFPTFRLCYVENDGMAFGIEWFDKLALTLFRVLAVGLLSWYIHRLVHRPDVRPLYLVSLALIIAGAAGNIIDCLFYGRLFGYAPYFYGRVIDMFSFSFFPPVFNVADSCITCGVLAILLFFRRDLDQSLSSSCEE